jgi:predicted phage terminase large subunit-like protein
MTAADLEFLPAMKAATPEVRAYLRKASTPRLQEAYTKHIPHPPQQLFLTVNATEVMYGGAAGGGKSDALLMAALQYVDVPGYSALLLRRTWPDLSLPGAIMDRAREWLQDTDAQPREGGRTWAFPSGARLTFGYLQHDKDKYRYQSAEFQFIGFDELTQFAEPTYEYMFSRIRRPSLMCLRCRQPVRRQGLIWMHAERGSDCKKIMPDPKVLEQYGPAKDGTTLFTVPLRMRSSTNPGGIGHVWVRDRFIDPETKKPEAVFIPALLDDNPSLDRAEYRKSLEHLAPVDRERLLAGDWDVMEEGAYFQRHWFNFVREVPAGCKWVRYWDLAATTDGDYTAGCLLGLSNDGEWYIADVRRIQSTPQQVEKFIRGTAEEDGRHIPIRMEQEPGSSGVMAIDQYRRRVLMGFDFRADKKIGSKEVRANPASSATEAGLVSILSGRWNRDFLDEIALFPNGAHDDQCDAFTGAFASLASRKARILA